VDEPTDDESPCIETRDLSLATREGPVDAGVDLSFRRGRRAAAVGRPGHGRSALLLTLAGRMRGWTGRCRVAGYDAATQTGPLRHRGSLARISDLVDLEPRLTVAESITERALIDAMPLQRAGQRFETSCAGPALPMTWLIDGLRVVIPAARCPTWRATSRCKRSSCWSPTHCRCWWSGVDRASP
jgi:ABC-type glutathione transport system ATPase component